MLDPYTYRSNESLAKSDPSLAWRAKAHIVDHFENIGFPVRIYGVQEMRPLLNSMQENRFYLYMQEMDGLTDKEHKYLLDACLTIYSFQRHHFPQVKPVLPLSVLMSVLCLFRKILNIHYEVNSILEIGPGCGYLSLLIDSDNEIASYSQIEACESFYILQNLINYRCFGGLFKEHAFTPDALNVDNFWTPEGQNEVPPVLEVRDLDPICEHFPWWHIDKVIGKRFQVVTSNANLLEFKPEALDDYLSLITKVLTSDGALLAQCCGSHIHGTPADLFRKTEAAGLRLVFEGRFNDIHNALWVRQEHSASPELAARVFSSRPGGRKMYTIQDIVSEVMVRI